MKTLDVRFMEMKDMCFKSKQVRKGYLTIGRVLKFTTYLKMCWEIITTIVLYAPSTSNYMRDMIHSVRMKWDVLSVSEQENIIAAFVHMNRHGNVERALNRY